MGEATQASFDPVWLVLAVAMTTLLAIVTSLVRSDRLASQQPVQTNSSVTPTEFGEELSAMTSAKTANRSALPPR